MLKALFVVALILFVQLEFAQDDVAAIKVARMASNAAIARHDVDGVAKNWLPDFVITLGKGVTEVGRDTVIASSKKLFATNATVSYKPIPESIVIDDNGIMAWETEISKAKNSYSQGGNYSAMWRKVNGAWKLQAELFVSLKK